MHMRKRMLLLAAAGALLLLLAALSRTGGGTYTLDVQVVDGRTEAPLAGAAVVIAEAAGVHITGADGRTGPIAVPRALRVRMGAEQAPWREVTVLAYCDGYYPYALFHVALYPDRARSGPRVYLFPDDGSMDGTPFVLIEAPEADWARALIEQYRPETG